MNGLLYAIIFIIGSLFGSFFTLAVHRIPLGQNITTKHSYCPSCQKKLKFFDLIPILSYIFLGGKCRYCKKKIRPRYLILEVLSGLTFLLLAFAFHINIYKLEELRTVTFVFTLFYFVSLFMIAGIDKENHKIQKSILLYGLIITIIYILYLYVLQGVSIYRYVIYLGLMTVLLLLDTQLLRKKATFNYTVQILTLSMYMAMCTDENIFFFTTMITIVSILFKTILQKLSNRRTKNVVGEDMQETSEYHPQVPIGFLLCICNIIVVIGANFVMNY